MKIVWIILILGIGCMVLIRVQAVFGAGGKTVMFPEQSVVDANTAFAIDLYLQLRDGGSNLFFSPYSIYNALVMTAEGARGETALEIGKALHFSDAARRRGTDAPNIPWRTSLIHTRLAALNEHLTGKDPTAEQRIRKEIEELRKAYEAAHAETERLEKKQSWREYEDAVETENRIATKLNNALTKVDQYILRIANALWGEKTYPFSDDYINTIARYYKTSGVFPADFKNNFSVERARINNWVTQQTEGCIKDIIPPLSQDEAMLIRLILTNAIYFKGEWSEPFDETETRPRDFFLSAGGKIQTPMMSAQRLEVGRYAAFNSDGSFFNTPREIEHGQKYGLYPGWDGFALLELPYKGNDLSMILFAPNSTDGLESIEKMLTPERLNTWINQLEKRKVHVLMPTFKFETTYEMKKMLRNMGMVRTFTDPNQPQGADFTGMCASTDPRFRFYVSEVLHKAFVEVNEKGTEAAAATAVLMAGASMPVTVPFTPTFKADRPFLFLIRETRTGILLFMGRFIDPRGDLKR